jgi:eukaryotic-like serine/threonine-protein kinase
MFVLMAGCAGFRVQEPLIQGPIDWPMAGRTASGVYADASRAITLPLEEKWDFDLSAGVAQNSCVIVDSVLFCGTLRGELVCLNARNGKELGSKKVSGPISGSPVLHGNEVFFCSEAGKETMFDYDLTSGDFVWKKNLGGISASPIIAGTPNETPGLRLYVGSLEGVFYALNMGNGETIWKYKCAAPIAGTACAADSFVYCADLKGTVYAFSVESGKLQWKRTLGGPVYAGLSAHGGVVYAGSRDHFLYALDGRSGSIRWTYDCGERIMAAASVTDSLIVVPALNGTVTALSPEGRKVWAFTARSPISAPCPIVDGMVFAASLDTHVYALSSRDGAVLWKHSIDARIKTAPLIWNRSLFIIGDDKTLYSFGSR